MNWLITGGCGFIGVNLIDSLIKEGGHKIRVFDNLSVGTEDDLSRVCEFKKGYPTFDECDVSLIVADLVDPRYVDIACQDIDVIVHLGARSGVRPSVTNPSKSFTSNVIGTFNILDIARKYNIKQIVNASSGACIGDVSPINEELPGKPVSPYGATKLCGEALCHSYHACYDMNIASLRFSNVYGPYSNNKTSLVAKFIKKIMYGKSLEIYGDGEQTRDFIHTSDLINAIRKASEFKGGEAFQICTGIENSVNYVTKILVDMLVKKGFDRASVTHIDAKVGDMKSNAADHTKAKMMLGWSPVVEITAGFEETIKWFLKEGD